MTSILNSTSLSAPKLLYFSKSDSKNLQIKPISQESSPSIYSILNFPIKTYSLKQKNFFFDNSIPLSELQMLGEASPLEPINQRFEKSCEKAKSECKDFSKVFHLLSEKTKKKIYFDFTNSIFEVEEKAKEKEKEKKKKLDIVIDMPLVKLQPAPIEKFKKRRERCSNLNETLGIEVWKGVVKRYNLKGRFGKISYGDMNVVVYEDDLVISGVNLRQFKNAIGQKKTINVEFKIKKSLADGKEKARPFDIKVEF